MNLQQSAVDVNSYLHILIGFTDNVFFQYAMRNPRMRKL